MRIILVILAVWGVERKYKGARRICPLSEIDKIQAHMAYMM